MEICLLQGSPFHQKVIHVGLKVIHSFFLATSRTWVHRIEVSGHKHMVVDTREV